MATTLRPDGLLETGSPVVAGCLLGRRVVINIAPKPIKGYLLWVSKTSVKLSVGPIDRSVSYEFPILIPAATVAEIDCNSLEWSVLCDATSKHGDDAYPLLDWLKKHAGGTT